MVFHLTELPVGRRWKRNDFFTSAGPTPCLTLSYFTPDALHFGIRQAR
jgi:hypothetical protein